MGEVKKVLEFLMGRNTPARREFIEKNLLVEAERMKTVQE